MKLVDAFRFKNPTTITFTFISPNGKSRIDRIYVQRKNEGFIQECKHLNFTFSDHQAVMLDLEGALEKTKKGNILWKLNTSTLYDPDFQNELEIFISNAKQKKKEYRNITHWWEREIKEKFKIMCTRYSKNKFKERNSKKNFYIKCLDQVKAEIDQGQNNFDDYYFIKNILKNIYLKDEEGKKIRGKLNYFIGNETVSVAKLIKEKTNGENRTITELEENDTGTKNPDVHQTIFLFYERLYSLCNHNPVKRQEFLNNLSVRVSQDMNLDLVKKITEDEVWNAIETMPQNKSPGIDGLPVEFYKKIWPWLKEEITIMFNHILDTEELSKTQTTGIITLLHKGGSRKILSNWRPISLLCSDYKILAKILTLRLKKILPYIIGQEQTGGLANRDISQNLTTYRNVIEWFSSQDTYKGSNLREKGAAIVSMDFEKAYDMVDRTFLYEVLLKMGFSQIFIRNIKSLYESSFSKVYVNGEMGKKIDLKRG
ncbi:Uncharacterized protein APZ42_033958, partial [Daphnia magna]